jgi:hypothetical protein
MVQMIVLSNYVSDGSYYSFEDEETITSFLLMFQSIYEDNFQDIGTLIRRYLQDGFYTIGDLGIYRKGLIVYRSNIYRAQDIIRSQVKN